MLSEPTAKEKEEAVQPAALIGGRRPLQSPSSGGLLIAPRTPQPHPDCFPQRMRFFLCRCPSPVSVCLCPSALACHSFCGSQRLSSLSRVFCFLSLRERDAAFSRPSCARIGFGLFSQSSPRPRYVKNELLVEPWRKISKQFREMMNTHLERFLNPQQASHKFRLDGREVLGILFLHVGPQGQPRTSGCYATHGKHVHGSLPPDSGEIEV